MLISFIQCYASFDMFILKQTRTNLNVFYCFNYSETNVWFYFCPFCFFYFFLLLLFYFFYLYVGGLQVCTVCLLVLFLITAL